MFLRKECPSRYRRTHFIFLLPINPLMFVYWHIHCRGAPIRIVYCVKPIGYWLMMAGWSLVASIPSVLWDYANLCRYCAKPRPITAGCLLWCGSWTGSLCWILKCYTPAVSTFSRGTNTEENYWMRIFLRLVAYNLLLPGNGLFL